MPIEPLIAYIDATYDELAKAYPQETVWVDTETGDSDFAYGLLVEENGYWHSRVHPKVYTDFKRTQRRIERGREQGWIDYHHVDELACGVFGVHPAAVYGVAWFDMPEDDRLQDRLAGKVEQQDEQIEMEAAA